MRNLTLNGRRGCHARNIPEHTLASIGGCVLGPAGGRPLSGCRSRGVDSLAVNETEMVGRVCWARCKISGRGGENCCLWVDSPLQDGLGCA